MRRSHLKEIEEQAALYALDALPSADAINFRRRVASGCPVCLSALQDCRRAVAMLPLAVPDAAPPPTLRQRILDRITGKPAQQSAGTIVRPDDTTWENSPVPGIETRRLHGRRTMLVRMAPGTVLPEHEHKYAEQCLVLEGSIRSDDMTANAGDFTYFPAGSVHSPLYTDTGCLLLIAYT